MSIILLEMLLFLLKMQKMYILNFSEKITIGHKKTESHWAFCCDVLLYLNSCCDFLGHFHGANHLAVIIGQIRGFDVIG